MIIDLIKEILLQHRNGISLEDLKKILPEKDKNKEIQKIIEKSQLFTIRNGIVFLRATLTKCKEDFLKEFDDYLQGKVSEISLRQNIVNNYIFFIPDSLFIEWLKISLDRKILIFDLLYTMILKPKTIKDDLKHFFNNLIEFYSILVIYSILIIKNYENNFKMQLKIIEKIEPFEETLKKELVKTLSTPDTVQKELKFWEKEFSMTEKELQVILKESFVTANEFSPRVLKRVIKNELNDFNFLLLLQRTEFQSFYEWITYIMDEKLSTKHNLFKDLGL